MLIPNRGHGPLLQKPSGNQAPGLDNIRNTTQPAQQLTQLLTTPLNNASEDPDAAAHLFNDLQLGRYSAGGMERGLQILESQMRGRFAQLEHAEKEQKKKAAEEKDKLAAKGEQAVQP